MTAQPLFQFGTVALDPASDCRVVRFQAALGEQFFDIAERERVPKIPTHGATISSGAVCRHLKIAGRIALFMISSGYQSQTAKVATHPTIEQWEQQRRVQKQAEAKRRHAEFEASLYISVVDDYLRGSTNLTVCSSNSRILRS
jgi:hypothetical protein